MEALRKYYLAILATLLLIVGITNSAYTAYTQTLTSDDAQGAVMFFDIMENWNFMLRGWFLPSNSYLLTDFPLYFILGLLIGMGSFTVKTGALVLVLSCAGLLFLIMRKTFGNVAALFFPAALMTAAPAAYELLVTPYHRAGTALFSLAALLIVMVIMERQNERRPMAWLGALSSVCFAGAFSDPYFIIVFVLPAFVAYFFLRLRHGSPVGFRLELTLALILICASAIGIAIATYSRSLGGPTIYFVRDILVATEGLSARVANVLNEFVNLFQSGVSREMGVSGVLRAFLMAVAWTGSAVFVFKGNGRGFTGRYVIMYFLVSAALLFTFLFSKSLFHPRYLLYFIFVNSVFTVLCAVSGDILGKWFKSVVLSLLVLTSVVNVYETVSAPRGKDELAELSAFLDENRLRYGFAESWTASKITMESEGRVRIRPVNADYSNRFIEPAYWLTKSQWYHIDSEEEETFIIVEKAVEQQALREMFGEPQRELKYNKYLIYVWPYNALVRANSLNAVKDALRQVGRVEKRQGIVTAYTEAGEKGFLLSRSVLVPTGTHRAVFEVMSSGNCGKSAEISILNMMSSGLLNERSSLNVQCAGDNQWKKYKIPFVVPDGTPVERTFYFNVYSEGVTGIQLRIVYLDLHI